MSCKERDELMKWDSWAFQYIFLFATIGKQLLHGRNMVHGHSYFCLVMEIQLLFTLFRLLSNLKTFAGIILRESLINFLVSATLQLGT